MVEVGREAGQIVFENEFAEELRIPDLDRDVPRQGKRAKHQDARQPEGSHDEAHIPRRQREQHDHDRGQERRDGSLGQRSQRHADVKQREIDSLIAFAPGPPGEHADSESRGQCHIHRSRTGVADDSRTRSSDERCVHLDAAPEAAEEKIHGNHQQCSVNRRGNAGRRITHSHHRIGEHRLPVVEGRLLEPGMSA